MNNMFWVMLMAANAANSAASISCSNASDTSVVNGLLLILFKAIDDWIS